MTIVRTCRYTIDPADVEELRARLTTLVAAVRATHPGLIRTVLTRFEDGTYTDSWYWDSAEHMRAAAAAARTMPEAAAAAALVRDRTAEDGEILDER